MFFDLTVRISTYKQMKRDELDRLRSSVKYAGITTQEKPGKRPPRNKDTLECQVQEAAVGAGSSGEETMSDAIEVQSKLSKLMHVACKRCAAKGCQKNSFFFGQKKKKVFLSKM